jgi:His-Xaa-Ser repeat protein HxsA
MSRKRTSIAMLLAGLPLLATRATGSPAPSTPNSPPPLEPLQLRPLNLDSDNLFAVHRSHSSHSSHRSSSGGGYATPAPSRSRQLVAPPAAPRPAPNPLYTPPSQLFKEGASGSQPVDPGRAEPVSPRPAPAVGSTLTLAEKRKLQIVRVQIALTALGLYSDVIDGTLNAKTKDGLSYFQAVKGLPSTGLMTTETLNALGVPAAQ